jgi:hypothetical protein
MIVIWGLAAGRGSTKKAARGALTVKEYQTREEADKALKDWQVILSKQEEK